MTPLDTIHAQLASDIRHALSAALKRESRLERAMRDAIDALENCSPAHAERFLKDGLKTRGR